MKFIRFLSVLFFLAAAALFSLYNFKKIKIEDHLAPVISMDAQSITISVNDDESKVLEGITATDKRDGDVTSSLIVEGYSKYIEPGRRNVTIAAFDKSSNVSKVSREIIYSDYYSPRFELNGPFRFPLGTQNLLEHVMVNDILDGDISNKVKIVSEYTVSTYNSGEYPMLLSVANDGGDVAEIQVTVSMYDPEKEAMNPKINLSEYLKRLPVGTGIDPWDFVTSLKVNGRSFERGADGRLWNGEESIGPESFSMDMSKVDIAVPGCYEITYYYEDASARVGNVRLVVIME